MKKILIIFLFFSAVNFAFSDVPSGVRFVNISTWSLSVQWDNQPASSFTCVLSSDNFKVLIASDSTPIGQNTTNYFFPLINIVPNTTYWFQVKVSTDDENYSAPVSTSTLSNPPAGAYIAGFTSSTIVLQWLSGGNPVYTRWGILRSTDNFLTSTASVTGFYDNYVSLSSTDSLLSSDATYWYKVCSFNENQVVSDFGGTVFVKTIDNIPPSDVTSLQAAAAAREGMVSLSWVSPGDNTSTGTIQSGMFEIKYSTDSTLACVQSVALSTSCEEKAYQVFTVTGLSGGSTYYFRLRTADEAGNWSGLSNGATCFAQSDVEEPDQITTIIPVKTGFRHVRLKWIAPCEDGPAGNKPYNLAGTYNGAYWIKYASFSITDQLWDNATTYAVISTATKMGAEEVLTLTGLQNAASYYFSVKTRDSSNFKWSVASASSPLAVPYDTVPAAVTPSLPSQKIINSLSYAFNWSTPSSAGSDDANYGDYVSSYTLNLSTYNTGLNQIGVSTLTFTVWNSTYCEVPGLRENTTYWWVVYSRDTDYAQACFAFLNNVHYIVTNSVNEPPGAVNLVSVSTASTGNQVVSSGVLNDINAHKNVEFKWNPAADPDPGDFTNNYFLYYSTEVSFNCSIKETFISTVTACRNSLLDDATYYWFVVAVDSGAPFWYNVTFTTSAVWSFRVNGINEPPRPFSLVSPAAGSIVYAQTPELKWGVSVDPDPGDSLYGYTLYYSSTGVFGSGQFIGVANSSITKPLVENATYWWYVSVQDNGSGWSSKLSTQTAVSYFVVNASSEPPSSFSIICSTGLIRKSAPLLRWTQALESDPFDYVKYYFVYYSSEPSFAPGLVTFSSPVYSSSVTLQSSNILTNTTYYWNVRSYDATGLFTDASARSFCLLNNAPPGFDIISPTGSVLVSTLRPSLKWRSSIDADGDTVTYKLYYSVSPSFTANQDPVIYGVYTGLAGTEYIMTFDLMEDTTYYWKIAASDGWQETMCSSIGVFIVNGINSPPRSFSLLNPDGVVFNGSVVVKTAAPVLKWSPAVNLDPGSYIESYSVYYSSFDETDPKCEVDGAQLSAVASPLAENTTYWWYVVAYTKNRLSSRQSSDPRGKIIVDAVNEIPDDFNLFLPSGPINTVRPVFRWQQADRTEYWEKHTYDLYFGSNVSLGDFVRIPGIQNNSYKLPFDLQEDVTYWWKVEVMDSADNRKVSNQTFYLYVSSANNPPYGFNLLYPEDNSFINTRQPSLLWEKTADPEEIFGDRVNYTLEYNYIVNETTWSHTVYQKVNMGGALSYTPNISFIQNTTYYWKITASDTKGNATVSQQWHFYVLPLTKPLQPAELSTDFTEAPLYGKKIIFYWKAVSVNEDGSSNAGEIKGYNVYYSTDFFKEPYEFLGFTDGIYYMYDFPKVKTYYYIRAITYSSIESKNSQILCSDSDIGLVASSDEGEVFVTITPAVVKSVNGNGEALTVSKIEPDLFEIKVSRDNVGVDNYNFNEPAVLSFRYNPSTSGAVRINSVNRPSVFYFNGVEYIYIGGELDLAGNVVTVRISKSGLYKIREAVAPSDGFRITTIEPRKIFTPNGDNKWDDIRFYFLNNTPGQVEGEIFDVSGRHVARMEIKTDQGTYFSWNGKDSSGNMVEKGIYIYQLKCGSIIKNGTVIVAK